MIFFDDVIKNIWYFVEFSGKKSKLIIYGDIETGNEGKNDVWNKIQINYANSILEMATNDHILLCITSKKCSNSQVLLPST